MNTPKNKPENEHEFLIVRENNSSNFYISGFQ